MIEMKLSDKLKSRIRANLDILRESSAHNRFLTNGYISKDSLVIFTGRGLAWNYEGRMDYVIHQPMRVRDSVSERIDGKYLELVGDHRFIYYYNKDNVIVLSDDRDE